jgi:sugar-specific transcriptional regulator TrmB
MSGDVMEKLVKIGFSEYEAKTYVALLRRSPATGYQVAKESGVPRSMIYEVLGKLAARGAVMVLPKESGTKYAPFPAGEFLDKLQNQHEKVINSLKQELPVLDATSTLEYVWNIEGHDNIMAKAREMIVHSQQRIYLSLQPEMFPGLREDLQEAAARGVRVVVYSTEEMDMPGGRVVTAPIPDGEHGNVQGLWLVLVVDGEEVLMGESMTENRARASWTGSPLFVFVAEHHLRTDLYLPQVLALLGDKAKELIREEDWELFACAFESRLD